ncbi:MAG: menaquinone biosynthesis family protein [Vampirovibrionales bacterium]
MMLLTLTETQTLTLAHSPDADDAFMFYALTNDKVNAEGLKFDHVLVDIETLNHAADQGLYDMTAISLHAYAKLHSHYALMAVGGSIGNKYGPKVIAREALTLETLRDKGYVVAVPGERTTAYLLLKLWAPDLETRIMPFDEIQPAVAKGLVDVGLIIHEGQLTYQQDNLFLVEDLGAWWFQQTGLLAPLGFNAIKRSLGQETMQRATRVLQRSVSYALEHREEALKGALHFARALEDQWDKALDFVGMYVNEHTLLADAHVQEGARVLLQRGYEAGIIPELVVPEFIMPE